MSTVTAPAGTSTSIRALDVEIGELFDLDPQTRPAADLGGVLRSADCTNDGCTDSCNSCGC